MLKLDTAKIINRSRASKPKFIILTDFPKPFKHDNIYSCMFAKNKL